MNWEYILLTGVLVIDRTKDEVQGDLNDLGRKGWEIVAVTNDGCSHTIYLKRERSPSGA